MELMRIDAQTLFISHCNRYASKYPNQSRFPFLLGIRAMQADSLESAMIFMREAIKRDRQDADAWGELAGIHDRYKQFRESDSCFKEALRIDSLSASFNNNFAYALSERNTDMNEDMYNALKADSFPVIKYELTDKIILSDWKTPESVSTVNTNGTLTIAGISKLIPMPVTIKMLTKDRFQITGSKTLSMHSFHITPPTALWGLIKADDRLTVRFELLVNKKYPDNLGCK